MSSSFIANFVLVDDSDEICVSNMRIIHRYLRHPYCLRTVDSGNLSSILRNSMLNTSRLSETWRSTYYADFLARWKW